MFKYLLKNKRAILYLKCFIALGILVLIFQIIPIADVFKALQNADPAFIITAFAIIIGMRYFSAFRIKVLTNVHKIKISVQQFFEISLITSMYSLLLPSSPADAEALSFLIVFGSVVFALVRGIFELRNTFFNPQSEFWNIHLDTKGIS